MSDISDNPPLFKVQDCGEQGEDDRVRRSNWQIGRANWDPTLVHEVPADQFERPLASVIALAHGPHR
jgi:hypothetical protein